MDFRSEWMTSSGVIRTHTEVFFHAVDRDFPLDRPVSLLIDGVQNGGDVSAWERCLPDSSMVVGIDDMDCKVPGVRLCDWADRGSVFSVLRWLWFDVIICSADHACLLWPYLLPGGRMMMEDASLSQVQASVISLWSDSDSWLPVEEMMRVCVYQGIVCVEKRNPKVIPYMHVGAGSESPYVERGKLIRSGTLMIASPESS